MKRCLLLLLGLFALAHGFEANAPKVQVALYYESLCPYCQQFITTSFKDAFEADGLLDIMDVDFIPYGNARESPDGQGGWSFTCQHGARECAGNLHESCAIGLYPNVTDYMPYVICVEGSSDPATASQQCANTHKLDYSAINQCVTSSQGNTFQHQNAVKTDALNPPHKYVPWIVIDGVHTEDIQQAAEDNLLKFVCGRYTGTLPSGCNSAAANAFYKNDPEQRCVNKSDE